VAIVEDTAVGGHDVAGAQHHDVAGNHPLDGDRLSTPARRTSTSTPTWASSASTA
jgi:hypothetical protein